MDSWDSGTLQYRVLCVHGCDLFFSTLPCSCLACVPVVVFVSCCHDVSASRSLLVNKLCCLINWLSICRKLSRLWESCLSIVFIHVGLGTVPCINSAREFIRVNELCCLVKWLCFVCLHQSVLNINDVNLKSIRNH